MTTGPQRTASPWNWLLILPFLALAFPAFYAHAEPSLWGFPFFYWYQFACLIGTVLVTWLVYFMGQRR